LEEGEGKKRKKGKKKREGEEGTEAGGVMVLGDGLDAPDLGTSILVHPMK